MWNTIRLLIVLLAASLSAQLSETASWASVVGNRYRVVPNITYLTANNWEAKLDVYQLRGAAAPAATLMYIHGGGWVGGTKEASVLQILPYLEMGWNVVNVEYRLARVSEAPAAVEDCLCALRWIIRNAKEYNIDVDRIVVTGHSAGGHLALTTGMIPASAGLDRRCPGNERLRVAMIVNWFGITDVGDLLEGPNMKTYAVQWLGARADRQEVAKRLSPLTYVQSGLPPVITIHGDADPVVPYAHATRLHEALKAASVPNRLMTVPKGGHGGFSMEDQLKAFQAIREMIATPIERTGNPR